ncbi:MAG: hypothetical protein WD670_02260, partial [Actinomycetota bacterium]
EPPAWPLSRPTRRELARWASEWATPQAVEWESKRLTDEVARYVRNFVQAEARKSPVELRKLVNAEAERLGLTLNGLARNRWIIDSEPEQQQVNPSNDPDRASAKARLTAIEGGAAAS